MKARGPMLGKTSVVYSRAVNNVIYVGFNESLKPTENITTESFLMSKGGQRVQPKKVKVHAAHVEVRFAAGIDCESFETLSYTVPSTKYLANYADYGVPSFEVDVEYDEAGETFVGTEERIVRNINKKRAGAKLSVLSEDAEYASLARLLAEDPELELDGETGAVKATSFGSVDALFKLFRMDVPSAVLVSTHGAVDSDFAFE